MEVLQQLADALGNHRNVSYQRHDEEDKPLEELTIEGNGQKIEVSHFEDTLKVRYSGDNAEEMRATLDTLQLPGHYSVNHDLGTRVFYLLKGALKDQSGPANVEQSTSPWKASELYNNLDRVSTALEKA